MEHLAFESRTYHSDLGLFSKLGLKPFHANSQNELFVGEYKIPEYEKAGIKIFVTCLPAQFWRFEIQTDEDKKFEASTGSGTLSEYWPSVLQIAEGMLVVKSL